MVVSPFNLVLLGAVHLLRAASRARLNRITMTITIMIKMPMKMAEIVMTISVGTDSSLPTPKETKLKV